MTAISPPLVYVRVKEGSGERAGTVSSRAALCSQLWKHAQGLCSWCLPSAGRRGDRSARGSRRLHIPLCKCRLPSFLINIFSLHTHSLFSSSLVMVHPVPSPFVYRISLTGSSFLTACHYFPSLSLLSVVLVVLPSICC
jgi:hypothetical protein